MPEIFIGLQVVLIAAGVLVLLLRLGNGLAQLGGARSPARGRIASEGARVEATALEAQLEETANRVLAVVRAHPEGVRLTEIGEALAIRWQTLVGPVNQLLNRGLIRKEGRTYYPQ